MVLIAFVGYQDALNYYASNVRPTAGCICLSVCLFICLSTSPASCPLFLVLVESYTYDSGQLTYQTEAGYLY